MNRRLEACVVVTTGCLLCAAGQAAPDPLWIIQFGVPESSAARASAPDGTGGVYVAGGTQGSLGGPNAGESDVFVARYDREGERLWAAQFGSAAPDVLYAAAPVNVGGGGGVFLTGEARTSLGGPYQGGGGDVLLARYDETGAQVWIMQFGSSHLDTGTAVAPDGEGGAYVGGRTQGDLGGPNAGLMDAFLARVDSNGVLLWVKQFGTSAGDYVHGLAADGAGGVYAAGLTGGPLSASWSGADDAFVARYDRDGVQIWLRQFGSGSGESAWAAAEDGAGGVYIGGWTQGSLGGPLAGNIDSFVARYDSTGNQLWLRQFGTPAWDSAWSLAPENLTGGVYVGGWTQGNLGGPLGGSDDAILLHYTSEGDQSWIVQFGTPAFDAARAVASDGAGGVYITGSTAGDIGIGDGDMFLGLFPGGGTCFANCDGSTTEPILTVDDFTCFIDAFAKAQGLSHEEQILHYANCDGSTQPPVLNVDDFTCFINAFAAGCP